MLESVLLLRFSEELAEQRVVEVDDGDEEPVGVIVFLADVDGQMTFRDRRRLFDEWHLIKAGVAGCEKARAPEPMGETTAPVADFRHRHGLCKVERA